MFISLTYNSVITLVAAGLFVSLGIALNPALGVALMVLESAIVLANLYRLKHQDTLSLASNQENRIDGDNPEESTSQILNGLGFRPNSSLENPNDRELQFEADAQERKPQGNVYWFYAPMTTTGTDRGTELAPSATVQF